MTTTPDLDEAVHRLFTFDPEALRNPFALYRRLRTEAPVYQYGPVVVLSRWDDVEMVFADTTRFSNAQVSGSSRVEAAAAALAEAERKMFREIVEFESHMLFLSDPPNHTRLRALTGRAFTPRVIGAMRDDVASLLTGFLDGCDQDGRIEAVNDFAFDLPLFVICNLLGTPPEDRGRIKHWAHAFSTFIGANYSDISAVHAAITDWRAYVRDLIAQSRARPGTGGLLTALVEAEEGGDRLSYVELEALVVNLLFGGHETTSNLILNGLVALLEHPDQFDALRHDRSLIPRAVEEIGRYATSVHTLHRVAVGDTEIHGVPVPAHQTIRLMLGAANRDEAHVPDPERFDITRENQRNLTFGRGIHFCIGAALARLELAVALEHFCDRYDRVELDADDVVMRRNFGLRGPERLPLRVTRKA